MKGHFPAKIITASCSYSYYANCKEEKGGSDNPLEQMFLKFKSRSIIAVKLQAAAVTVKMLKSQLNSVPIAITIFQLKDTSYKMNGRQQKSYQSHFLVQPSHTGNHAYTVCVLCVTVCVHNSVQKLSH